MRRALMLATLALLVPATAHAGGWATAGLSSTPAGTTPGKPWKTEITLMQHGRTPLENVQPAIVVKGAGGTKRFDATPTAKPGVYSVSVTFPQAGRYTYTVDDGFGNAFPHEFPAVVVGAAQTAAAPARAPVSPADDGTPWLPILVAAGAALLLAGGAVGLRRRRGGIQPA